MGGSTGRRRGRSCSGRRRSGSRAAGPRSRCSATSPTSRRWRRWRGPRRSRYALRLGCAVLVSTLHSPLHLAASIATVDQLSGGRLEVGLGTGGGYRQFAAFGVDPATYVARSRRAWPDAPPVVRGSCRRRRPVLAADERGDGAPSRPRSRRHRSGSAVRIPVRCVASLPSPTASSAPAQTTAAFAAQVRTLRGALADAGRDPATCRIAKRVYVTVDHDAGAPGGAPVRSSTGSTATSGCVTSRRWP